MKEVVSAFFESADCTPSIHIRFKFVYEKTNFSELRRGCNRVESIRCSFSCSDRILVKGSLGFLKFLFHFLEYHGE